MTRAPLASLLATAALAVAPAAALAQDAGGGQYKDPLTGGGGHHSTPAPTPGPTASAGNPSSGATAAAGSPSSSSSPSAKAGSTGAIPRTGFPVGMLMFAGALLLCGGLALRRVAGTTHT